MPVYVKRLGTKVTGVFLATLLALAAASQPFDLLAFHWSVALTVSGSAAFLALLEGLVGRFTGDPERPRISE